MKIAMFSDSFYPIVGGRENVIDNSMKELIKENDAFLCAPKIKGHIDGKDDKDLPYKIYRCNSIKVGKSEYLSIPNKSFRKKVEAEKPDIIHVQTKFGLLNYAFKLRKKYNIPVVTTIHTNYKEIYNSTLPKFLANFALKYVVKQMNKCDAIFAVSNYMKNQVESLGVKKPIYVIKNGINFYTTKMQNIQQCEFINKKYKINANTFVLLYVGRLIKEKNILLQLETIKDLSKKTNIDFKFIIVGSGKDENLLKNYVVENELQNYIIFTGQIVDAEILNAIYSRANLFYFLSLADNDPLTILEAAYNLTPSFVVENTGGAERITNNINGFVIQNDKISIENKIVDILNNCYDLIEIGKNAKKQIPINWNITTSLYIEKYHNILNMSKKHSS